MIRHLGPLVPVLPGGVAAIGLALGGDAARQALRYDRAAVLAGEVWRLVTGHLVHLGWMHMVLNVVALALVWALVGGALTGAGWAVVTGACVTVMGAGFVFLEPVLAWYVGLSGLLHGLFAAGALGLAVHGRRDGLVMLGLVVLKLTYEQLAGPLPLTAETAGGPVIVDAHLYGAVGGLAGAAAVLLRSRARSGP